MRAMKWRPASEIELDEPETVIVSVQVGTRGSFVDLAWCDLETFTPTDGDEWPEDAVVTHWMQLPDPA